ncbi:hypothetical protein E2P81_ATG02706 [Venturia nashicola]|nr:hypothetical protein E2P81_ATG02706 [Venturia nashicola]
MASGLGPNDGETTRWHCASHTVRNEPHRATPSHTTPHRATPSHTAPHRATPRHTLALSLPSSQGRDGVEEPQALALSASSTLPTLASVLDPCAEFPE